ncbi:MAG: BMP family ABC transporter substrate-binding protein, partial [Schwartzia sp.]|nr:BMP family ABC transporter substrate-binding protein [Schwartzia sp. (in: firmicutes)]
EWMGRNLPLVLVALTIVALVVVIRSFRLPDTERQIVVGCVLLGPKEDGGWSESHYEGLLRTCRQHDCPLVVRDNVPETRDASFAAVAGLVGEGCNVIFLTRFNYGQYMDEIARKYPRVAFFGVAGEGLEKNCTSYFARLYQVRYLAGVVAGLESRTGVLGYVAGLSNPQTIRGINAYALGMRSANPKARLLVRFTGNWENEAAERESVALLAGEGADVITCHSSQPYALREADKRGLYSIGYDSVRESYSPRFLTAALYDWPVLYERVLGDYLRGRTNFSRSYWLGVAESAVKLHPMSPAVSPQTVSAVSWERGRLLTDWEVFSGTIYDNEGRLRCDRDERISDEELFLGMDWFVEGVEIYE